MDFDDDTNILEFELKSNDLALANQDINVGINGTSFTVTTDINGEFQLAINLGVGEYSALCSYGGTSVYAGSSVSSSILVTKI